MSEYINELLKEKNAMATFPGFFVHAERLVDIELVRVHGALSKYDFKDDLLNLPDPEPLDERVSLQEKVFIPVNEHPEFNFVGRILGPRGMSARQLEEETGCKIMIRGRGSNRDSAKEDANRGKPNWEHLDEKLHILVQCDDTEKRARAKLANAVDRVKKLLVPAPGGVDELKRRQLMELSIINGTYRSPAKKTEEPKIHRLMPLELLSPIRPPVTTPSFFPSAAANFFACDSPLPSPLKRPPNQTSASTPAKSAFEFNDLIRELTYLNSTTPKRSSFLQRGANSFFN